MQSNLRLDQRTLLALAGVVLATASLASSGGGTLASIGSVGDSCDDASFEVTAFPFTDAAGDTSGLADDLDLSLESEPCIGGGNQFPGSGTGPDAIYRFQVDAICDIEITLTPEDPGVDLALYVVGSCESGSLAGTCQGVSDDGVAGESETVSFRAVPLAVFFVVVDGYAGDAGPYSLTASEVSTTGCSLVPVELQQYGID